ncbi:MAG TPA: DNA-binding protein, partial [Candidatus Nanopelagicales bacterium]|nr:DNA-binding protein [Candidatus Nanopelagicales bacterium]
MSAPGPVVPPSRAPRTGKARVRSLADDLRSRDDDAIATLLRARPDLLHPVPADLSALSTRATTSTSVARALDRLDRGALGVLEALAALPEPTRLTDLAAGLRAVPRRQLTATVGRLRELALLWGTDRALHLVRSVRQAFGDHPAGLGPALADTRRGVRPYAADPGLAARVLATAPADASTALQQLLWGPPVGFLPGADRQVSADTATTAVEWLLARSLLEPLDASTVVVPREVALPLRDGVLVADVALAAPEVRVAAQHDPARVDRTAAQQAFETTRAVAALLSLWSSSPPARLRSGGLGVRDLTRTAASLDLPEARTALLVEVCHAAGLLASDGEIGESWCPTPAYDQWLERPAAAQWAVLAQTWLSMTRLPGLGTGPEAAEPRPNLLSRELDHPGAPDLRRATLEVFDRLPTGAAPDPADLFSLLAWSRPRGAVQRRRAMAATTLQEAEQLGVTGL